VLSVSTLTRTEQLNTVSDSESDDAQPKQRGSKGTATLFRERAEWADVRGVAQQEAAAPVCPILYSPEFADTMDFFRAVIRLDERSPRALELTGAVIRCNPSNYTAWQFRRLCLYALQRDLAVELDDFVFGIAPKNPKNYQLWHHRRACAERLAAAATATSDAAALGGIGKRELDFAHKQILLDEKNLHAWAHRQWAVDFFSAWDGELAWVHALLESDVRNNSAWNHRFYVATHQQPVAAARRAEADYALAAIGKAPNNESAWSYLRGVLTSPKAAALQLAAGDSVSALVDHVEAQCRAFQQRLPASAFSVSLQVDLAEWRMEQLGASESSSAAAEVSSIMGTDDREALRRHALQLCEILREQRDVLHSGYWLYRSEHLKNKTSA